MYSPHRNWQYPAVFVIAHFPRLSAFTFVVNATPAHSAAADAAVLLAVARVRQLQWPCTPPSTQPGPEPHAEVSAG